VATVAAMRAWVVDNGPCPYLPGRRFRAVVVAERLPEIYRELMDHGFRRSGSVAYLPDCHGCRACVPLRVDVPRFAPRRDQRRCAARNGDLVVRAVARGGEADERTALWGRYQAAVHGSAEGGAADLAEAGGVDGCELEARDASGRLLAVSVVDRFADALSSVYCYWDPAQADRGLGTFMALAEIAHARSEGLRWWYLGYWVDGCGKMAYKRRYGPHELLVEGAWREPLSDPAPPAPPPPPR
jgi:arginine-tRNA-protein transferase